MKTFPVLVLFLTLSSASGLKCYQCSPTDSQPCSKTEVCDNTLFDRCGRVEASGTVTQSCLRSELCISPMTCCEQDLCNNSPTTVFANVPRNDSPSMNTSVTSTTVCAHPPCNDSPSINTTSTTVCAHPPCSGFLPTAPSVLLLTLTSIALFL